MSVRKKGTLFIVYKSTVLLLFLQTTGLHRIFFLSIVLLEETITLRSHNNNKSRLNGCQIFTQHYLENSSYLITMLALLEHNIAITVKM